jgi:predicted ATPase
MIFRSLNITNLRAIREFEAIDLGNFIMVAGQNGSGKSCVFDAIRLLKSAYGGSPDEHTQWFGEFAINLADKQAVRRMFRDSDRSIDIVANFELSPQERGYMIDNAAELLWPIAWERVTKQRIDPYGFNRMSIASQLEQLRAPVEEKVAELQVELQAMATTANYEITLTIDPDSNMSITPCLPVTVAFQTDMPEHLGVIEYHGASRAYTRQAVGGINLDSEAFRNERRQQRLYNSQNKYQNVKTELASGYLRTLIAKEAERDVDGEDLNETLKELFRTFFPDKEYLGVQPTPGGGLEFPVRLPEGGVHDIDDLSSGEKEILYGYLRLRNSTPRRSVILLDEPELHLNPSLLQGFADFYHRHLGVAQDNQLWLVTHSDTLLRQAIGNSNYRVFHMQTANTSEGNQASDVVLDDDIERALVDLVGDLAAYRPHAKVVVLEGTSKDGFDEKLIRRLFPDFAKKVNLVSAESKKRVKDLYTALNFSAEQLGIGNRFFAIVDRDAEGFRDETDAGTTEHTWDVYHVENFLLSPAAIGEAVESLEAAEAFADETAVVEALKESAASIVDRLVLEEVQAEVNDALVSSIAIGASPESTDLPEDLAPSITASLERLASTGSNFSKEFLRERVATVRAELTEHLQGDSWLKRFPGRLILSHFANVHLAVNYESFRNVVMDKLAASDERPENMRSVLDDILAA